MKFLFALALVACCVCSGRPPFAEARHEQDGDRLLLRRRSLDGQPQGRRRQPAHRRTGRRDAASPSRPTATPSRSRASTTATPTSSPSPPPAAFPSASPIIPTPTTWSAGLPTASAFSSAPAATACPRYTQLFTVAPEGGLPGAPAAADGGHRRLLARRQAHGLCAARSAAIPHRLRHTSSPGGGIAAAAPVTSGSSTSPTSARRRSRAPIPTTSARCGSATRSTSSPTANGPMTLFRYDPQSKQVDQAARRTPARTSCTPAPVRAASSTSSSARSTSTISPPIRSTPSRSTSRPI